MKIWVDADACPVVIKEILFRAADRTGIITTLVANRLLKTPPSPNIRAMQVVAKGGFALNPRGEFYTTANIAERLAMRNLMEELRGTGMEIGGPAAFNQSDRQAFAAELDKFLARNM